MARIERWVVRAVLLMVALVVGCSTQTVQVGGVRIAEGTALRPRTKQHIADKSSNAIAVVTTDIGHGMAFVIDREGHLLTNRHVVEDAGHIESVRLPTLGSDFEFKSVEIVYIDPKWDLALLKIESPHPLPFLRFATNSVIPVSDFVEEKDPVLIMGDTSLATENLQKGNKSQLIAYPGQITDIAAYQPIAGPGPFLGTSIDVQPGQSGGPILDRYGRVAGIVTWTWKDRQGGFAIPISFANRMLRERPRIQSTESSHHRLDVRAKHFLAALESGEVDVMRRLTSPSYARSIREQVLRSLLSPPVRSDELLSHFVESLENLISHRNNQDPFAGLKRVVARSETASFRREFAIQSRIPASQVSSFLMEMGNAYLEARYFANDQPKAAIARAVQHVHSLSASRRLALSPLFAKFAGEKMTIQTSRIHRGVYGPKAQMVATIDSKLVATGTKKMSGLKKRIAIQLRLEWGDWYVAQVQEIDSGFK